MIWDPKRAVLKDGMLETMVRYQRESRESQLRSGKSNIVCDLSLPKRLDVVGKNQ